MTAAATPGRQRRRRAPGPDRTGAAATPIVEVVGLYVVSITGALAIAALLVELTGGSWQEVVAALLDGSLRAPGRWGATLGVAVPLSLVAVGTIVSSRAGLVNIGQEGQLLVGAALATYVGTRLPASGPVVVVALLVAGVAGGAAWSGIAGVLRYWRRVPEVLSTLLLVFVAANLVGYALRQPWLLLAPAEGRSNRNQVSEQLPADTRLPRPTLFGNEIPVGVVLAVAAAVLVAFFIARTLWGFRLRMLGHNPRAARRSGVDERRYGVAAMLVTGGFAGLAGAVMLAGGDFANYQFVPNFSVDIGWTGLLVALVARNRVLAVLPLAVVFAALRTASGFLAATGVERRITDVVQALLVLALLVPPAVLFLRSRRRAVGGASVGEV